MTTDVPPPTPRPDAEGRTSEPPPLSGPLPRIGEHAGMLAHGTAELRRTFGPTLGEDTVERVVAESHEELLAMAPDPAHRESIAVRFAAERLEALADARGLEPRPAPHVLFVCVQNAGRSQLAAALLAARAGDALRISSAGSQPADRIHENVAPVLSDMGADPADAFPKPLTGEVLAAADYVITMGCGDDCAVAPHQDVRDWPVGDPAEADWERLQEIVAEIEDRVDAFWREVSGAR